MDKAKIAQKGPYKVELKKNETYAWCRCGRSDNQPFCDGSHQVTNLKPEVFKAEKDETAFLCGCKQTKHAPYCDGTHRKL